MDLRSIYQQAQAMANAAAFKKFDLARVAEFLRFCNRTGPLDKYSVGERLLAVWLTYMLSGVKLPLTLAALAECTPALHSTQCGAGVTAPFWVSDFERAAAVLGVPAESLTTLANEVARQARAPQTARPASGGP